MCRQPVPQLLARVFARVFGRRTSAKTEESDTGTPEPLGVKKKVADLQKVREAAEQELENLRSRKEHSEEIGEGSRRFA